MNTDSLQEVLTQDDGTSLWWLWVLLALLLFLLLWLTFRKKDKPKPPGDGGGGGGDDDDDDGGDDDDDDDDIDPSAFWYKVWLMAQRRPPDSWMKNALNETEYLYYSTHKDEFVVGAPKLYDKDGNRL